MPSQAKTDHVANENSDAWKSTVDANCDGRVLRSEGTADDACDLNSDGRVTRSEARKCRDAGFSVKYEMLR